MNSWAAHVRYIEQQLPDLLDAMGVTLEAAAGGALLAVIWGLVLTWPRMSSHPVIRGAAAAYIEVMRYTPLLIQIYLLYFGLPLIGLTFPAFACGLLALMLQHGAFLAEVFRAAIESIPQGQWMAGRSIGLRTRRVFTRIILPQAMAKVFAPLGNQMVLLAKDTSLLAAIGVGELTLTSKMIVERSAATFDVFIAIGLLYLALTTVIGVAARVGERLNMPAA
jgi:polar amino acid transport system permease protein